MTAQKWCSSRSRRVRLSTLAAFLLLGWSSLSQAATRFDIPYYFQDFDTNGNPVGYSFAEFNPAVDAAKQFLTQRYPASKPDLCQAISAFEDATSQASGKIAKISYNALDPQHYSCPSNMIEIKLTQYDNDPDTAQRS